MTGKALKEFRSWRKKRTFASQELAHKAQLVEFDLELADKLGREIPALTALLKRNIAELGAMLKSDVGRNRYG